MDGFRFSTELKARFAETDSQGIVHNSVYLVWFEVARIDYLERYAGGYPKLREQGIEAFVLETHVRYLRPARFADRIVIHARCSEHNAGTVAMTSVDCLMKIALLNVCRESGARSAALNVANDERDFGH